MKHHYTNIILTKGIIDCLYRRHSEDIIVDNKRIMKEITIAIYDSEEDIMIKHE